MRGIRHATSETNNNVVSSTNHHDPNTSKKPARSKKAPQIGWSSRYSSTRSGVLGHWGSSEPATDANPSSSSRINAVRIERRVRHTRATD